MTVTRLAASPLLERIDGFVTEDEASSLFTLLEGLPLRHDETGHVAEVDALPELRDLEARVAHAVGITPRVRSVRYRRYEVGEGHPLHADDYMIDGARLVATAMLVLRAPDEGGATELPFALPYPVAVTPRACSLVTWRNVTPEGTTLAASSHRGVPVRQGTKSVLLFFVYATLEDLRAADVARNTLEPHHFPPPEAGPLLACVVDRGLPDETSSLLRDACDARGIVFRPIDATTFDYGEASLLPHGAMLFRPAASRAAQHVEDHLAREGVATFYREPDGALFPCVSPHRAHERAGIPQPRAFPVTTTCRDTLTAFVARLGGYPVVLKAPGGEGGVGVLRADGPEALFGLVDLLVRGQGTIPWLSAYVPGAMHHRVIVVGDRAVCSYENPVRESDFRSSPSSDPADYTTDVPDGLARVALAAARAERVFFAGVDVLVHPTGRLYVLEVNFPCYFPHATLVAGIDVAGPMVDFLVTRAKALASETAATPAGP
mgnify:CR=1 FL=1